MKTIGLISAVLASLVAVNVSAETATAEEVCSAAADLMALESPMKENLVAQCSAQLKGKTFADLYVFTEEESYRIEEVCVEQAQAKGEEQFDQAYESCVIKEVTQFLSSHAL
jgi:hypothetical protein